MTVILFSSIVFLQHPKCLGTMPVILFSSIVFLQHPKCLGTMTVILFSSTVFLQHPKCLGTMPVLLSSISPNTSFTVICRSMMTEMRGDMIESGSNYICRIMSELEPETGEREMYNSSIHNGCYPLMQG